ncbi:hypothetical protein LBMAG53_00730 [Planctomycetota bacterium]|nr:hypothetical protein LBMAG53_00730 [Planctomycetota bacterium]
MVATGVQLGQTSEISKHLLGALVSWRFLAVVLAAALCLAIAGEEQRPPPWRITADGAVVHANAVSLLGMTFGDVMAKPVMRSGDLVFQDLSASGYGGRLTGQVELRGARPATGDRAVYAGRLAVEGVDFNAYLRSLGLGADSIGGTLSGKVTFTVPEGRIDDLEGEGEFLILGANLIQLPWLANLLVGDPTNRRDNDRAQVRFELGPDKTDGKGRIRILAAKIETPAVNVVASGVIDFDWQLDLRLRASPDGGMLKEIDLLRWTFGPVLRPLFGNILQYRMRGRMTEPVLILQPFSE